MTAPAKRGGWTARAVRRLTRLAARQWGVSVAFVDIPGGIRGTFDSGTLEVEVSSLLVGRDRINYLLHELGHAWIHADGLTRKRFTANDEEATTSRERLTLLEEEFEAWHRGRLIARRAGIVLDDSYEQALERSMMVYVRWCASDGKTTIGVTPDVSNHVTGDGRGDQGRPGDALVRPAATRPRGDVGPELTPRDV